jgi:superfamily II DNA or RNA helicase
MSVLREYALSSTYESVVAKATFRRPQHDAFEKFHQLMRALGGDIPTMSQKEIANRISDLGYLESIPSNLLFDLATGVGKTRLLGGLIVYLALARQTKNCLILAPRVAILDKLKRECDPASSKYLFIDRSLIANPNVCFRSDLLSFEPNPQKLNVFILSPQTLTGTKVGAAGDFGPSLRQYLTEVDDLVVFSDEAHHFGNKGLGAWSEAVAQLLPKLHLGFTATSPVGSEKKVVYSYGLNSCLKEGKYTKAVKLWVEPKPEDVNDDDWDHQTIDFGLRRLEAKTNAIAELRTSRPEFPEVSPVLLVAAKDIAHADKIGSWLKNYRGLQEDEVYIAHSGKKQTAKKQTANSAEAEISRLVAIDQPGNKVKAVVNVFQLSEGWDVTNVWVIAPLRSLATFTNAIQTIGRGLRLPNGRRVGDEEIDTLDVLCFGKEDFGSIVSQATKEFGEGPDGSAAIGIVGKSDHQIRVTRPIVLQVAKHISFQVPAISRIPGEPGMSFSPQITRGISSYVEVYDVGSGQFGTEDGAAVRRSFETVVKAATSHVIDALRFLDPIKHTAAVQKLVAGVLLNLGGKPGMEISTDAMKLGLGVMEAIRLRYRSIESLYVAGSTPTEVKITPKEVSIPIEFIDVPTCDKIDEWK